MSDIAYLGSARAGGCGILIPCTKIVRGCLASRLLDRERHPEFQGETRQFFVQMPADMGAWEKYNEVRVECRLQQLTKAEIAKVCGAYYRQHRDKLDKGAEVAWEHSFDQKYEVSAIQHGMNKYFDDPQAFAAEYQNNPEERAGEKQIRLDANQTMRRTNGIQRGVLPDETAHLIGAIDISEDCLWWGVYSFQSDFTCAVVDYGVFPEQRKRYVTLSNLDVTLRDFYRSEQEKNAGTKIDASLGAAWKFGLETLLTVFTQAEWETESGNSLPMDKVVIDVNYHRSTQTVTNLRKRSQWRNFIVVAKGQGTSLKKPYLWNPATKKKKGERRGHHWRIILEEQGAKFQPDTNAWKTIVAEACTTPLGDPGAFTLFQPANDRVSRHQMFADQLSVESGHVHNDETNQLTVWIQPPHKDNHFFDTTYMAFAVASSLGCKRPDHRDAPKARQKQARRRSLRETFRKNNPGLMD
ncbi:MAG: hypothetical protein RIK87_04195 [Fuerstiella sp.]